MEATFADLAKKEAAADAKTDKAGAGSKNANDDDEEKKANAEEELAEEDEEDGYGHDDDDYLQANPFRLNSSKCISILQLIVWQMSRHLWHNGFLASVHFISLTHWFLGGCIWRR